MKLLTVLRDIPELWELSFSAPDISGALLEVRRGDETILSVSRGETLRAQIHTAWKQSTRNFGENPEFDFALTALNASGKIRLCWRGYSFRLYVNGALEDEEWPLGAPKDGPWEIFADDGVTDFELSVPSDIAEDAETDFDRPFQNYVHPGHNTAVGDCMPFNRDGRWCLYYLLDRRAHRSKNGLGAHQWAQISSADLKHWVIHPMAVGITEQWEGSICTGSLIQKDGKTWAFYAVRMSDGTPARLTWAVSDDGVHFEKSNRYFALTEPYEPVSARDPMVFLGADGQYHMLVTTSLVEGGRYGGCLAHLTSADLESWTQHEPFIVPGYSDQPECSDYFEWNGWYYLVFSNFAIARYRMSRQPFGPWIRPENDLLDALEIQVPKTAPYGERRFSTGFLARRPRSYAGSAVTHELFQRPDGTLGVRPLEEILPAAKRTETVAPISLADPQGRICAELPPTDGAFRLKAVLEPSGKGALYGINLKLGSESGDGKHSYRIEFDPAAGTVTIARPWEDFGRGAGRDLLKSINLAGAVPIDMTVSGDILDLILGDGRAMTMRLDEPVSAQTTVELYAICGALNVKNITLYTL
ncbi:MAG: glycosyl hydrolase [Clostridia bacterium]|nr:glycosyl hydrolase [Clostridia bacterium]